MFRWHVVSAVFWRNVKQYFSGPLGYLFIVVFVTVCSVMAFSPQFFADNLANLDQLSRWFPMLLLFIIPAITMSTWADEKRQGTDSILFTLPASDLDILLGKFLAVAAVYSVALFFSLSQLIVLMYVGEPDLGVIATTYLGYWLAGLSLLSIGMFASSLTGSATVAFVLGALFCSVPVLIGQYARGVVGLERLGFDWNLRDFTIGLIPLSSVMYFLALTVFMLYLNLIVISRRHWSRGQHLSLGPQYFLRAVSMAVGLLALGYLCNTALSSLWTRADLTHEKLYTLDPATLETLKKVQENDRSVTVQAFVSSDVPRKFVNTKNQFVGLLRQFGESGGGNMEVRITEVKPNSDEALEAQTAGIEPLSDRSEVGGRTVEQDVYLGATISTSLGDVTIPFVDNESSIEYELSRSIAFTVDKKQQITVGIVDTDTFFGGPVFQGRRVPWAYENTLQELKKQFKIVNITQTELLSYVKSEVPVPPNDPTNPLPAKEPEIIQPKKAPDVLLVADPSSLDDLAMDALVKFVEAGNPTIILADPLPFRWTYQHPTQIGVLNAPRQPRLSPQSPYREVLSSSDQPKADNGTAARLLKAIGVEWDNGAAAWNLDNPHPSFKGFWPEYVEGQLVQYYGPVDRAFVFVRNRGNQLAFNQDSIISSGLKELLLIYPGSVRKSADSKFEFQPLVRLGVDSGITPWERLTKTPQQEARMIDPRTGKMSIRKQAASSPITANDLVVLEPFPQSTLDSEDHIVAARITGSSARPLDVVFITDTDFVSEVALAQETGLGQSLDNLSLLQNSIEVLAGNSAFVNLRNRRLQPRSLVKLERLLESYRKERTNKQEEAETEMRDQLAVEQKKLDAATDEIQSNESLNFIEKLQRTSQEASDAQKRFDLRQRKLQRELSQTITRLETEEQKRVSSVENWTRYASILTAPIPALILGFLVLSWRYFNEQKNIAPQRKV